jgi:L-malate glycosyltransferase
MKDTRYIAVHLLNDYSGSPRVLADFCKTQEVQSGDLTIVTSDCKGFLHEGLGEVKTIWYPRGNFVVLNFLSFAFAQVQIFMAVFLLAIRSFMRGEQVVVINNTILCLGSMIASRAMGAQTIAYVHELRSGPVIMRSLAEKVIHWTAHKIIFVSQFLSDQYQFEHERCFVLPNGLRGDFKTQVALDYESKFKQCKVLFVGSPNTYKGVDELIKISKKLPDIPFTAVFNCSEKELADFLSRNDVPTNLYLLSRELSLQNIYAESFLVLNLSLPELCVESFGLTILEGMSFACPCVVPPIGGHLDFFNDKCGLIAHAKDTDSIVNFITKLQADEDLWCRYADHALDIAAAYSLSAYKDRVDKFLREQIKLKNSSNQ